MHLEHSIVFLEKDMQKKGFILAQCNGSRLLHVQMKSDFFVVFLVGFFNITPGSQ